MAKKTKMVRWFTRETLNTVLFLSLLLVEP